VFHHAGIKIPYFAFFAHDSGKRCQEAPWNMLIAMGIAAILCIGIGSFPAFFYQLLPFRADFVPFSLDHVIGQVQLLFLSALAFTLLMRTGIYPPELRSTNLDFDWIYRRLGRLAARGAGRLAETMWTDIAGQATRLSRGLFHEIYRHHSPEGALARTWPTGAMALWITVILAAYLVLSYL
jgi:multicomponent Na+:H+ antiporter subunit D